jgi:hypothetical protein
MFFDAKVVFFGAQPKAFSVGMGSRYPLYLFLLYPVRAQNPDRVK